ncbi:hypothetical protein FPQ18DRAFT_343974 [Pyronema domesticum]|nr:hypothetical protein FPQ18DRAFT_343974 [Pyronema domesticum]
MSSDLFLLVAHLLDTASHGCIVSVDIEVLEFEGSSSTWPGRFLVRMCTGGGVPLFKFVGLLTVDEIFFAMDSCC